METEERDSKYLVILNSEDILGEFTQHDDALLFAYIFALHGDKGDVITVYKSVEGFEVAEEV